MAHDTHYSRYLICVISFDPQIIIITLQIKEKKRFSEKVTCFMPLAKSLKNLGMRIRLLTPCFKFVLILRKQNKTVLYSS